MQSLFNRHRDLLQHAVTAWASREFWAPFPEIPSGRFYGETAREDGESRFEALLNRPFDLPGHPESGRVGGESGAWGRALGITYPAAGPQQLIATAKAAGPALSAAGAETRIGALIEALTRLNGMSFLIAHATMHVTGQAFAMAIQAGGPHAQDRGLEALAVAWSEMTRSAEQAIWEKPLGKQPPLVIEKEWRIVPRGVALLIACNTFPTWNAYPGLFASLATGNPVIVKPHPCAILPLAITVQVLRQVFAEVGLPPDAVLLAADAQGAEVTKALLRHPDTAIIDYTGSSEFADWIRAHAPQAQLFTEETGVNSVTIAGTDDFDGMCANLAFSLSLYSGQMCTSPQNIYIPADGIQTDQGHKTFDAVAAGIANAVDALLADPERASGICGRIVRPAILDSVAQVRQHGRVIRDSAPDKGLQGGDTGLRASPLMVAVAPDDAIHDQEFFGPISFLIACRDARDAICRAADVAGRKGAITAALYSTDQALIDHAADLCAAAGVNLSVNLTGNIFVNQSAAFSDFHVTGANPAGNASLSDPAFVTPRFRRVMIRRPKAA